MKHTISVAALIAGIALISAPRAHAQTPTPTPPERFLTINFGAQTQTRTFTDTTTLTAAGQTSPVLTNQTVNGGFVFN